MLYKIYAASIADLSHNNRGFETHVLRTLTFEQRSRRKILLREIVAEYRDVVPSVGQVHRSSGVVVCYSGQSNSFPNVGLTHERFVSRKKVDFTADDYSQVCKK